MSDSYSKTEVNAKLDTVEERIDNSLNKMMTTIEKGFYTIDKRFELVENDIKWLKTIMMGIGAALFVAIAAIYFQNATQKPEKPVSPVTVYFPKQ